MNRLRDLRLFISSYVEIVRPIFVFPLFLNFLSEMIQDFNFIPHDCEELLASYSKKATSNHTYSTLTSIHGGSTIHRSGQITW